MALIKQDLIENSTTINNIYLKKFERCINSIQEDKKISEIKYFTVLVIGQSGVGKSCLIDNALNLRIPEKGKAKRAGIDGAEEGQGDFVTNKNEAYISNTVHAIRCIDTHGCDLNDNGIEVTIERCTKAYFEEDTKEFARILKNWLYRCNSQKKRHIRSKNLPELVQLSITNIQKAINGNFYEVLNGDIQKNLVVTLKEENNAIKNYTQEDMDFYFSNNFPRVSNEKNLNQFIMNLFVICFSYYFVERKTYKISGKISEIFNEKVLKTFVANSVRAYTELRKN